MPKFARNDVTGRTFGRYTVLHFLPDDGRHAKFLCRCSCGVEKSVMAQTLINGAVVSCGCYSRELSSTRKVHGHSGVGRTKTYNSWAGMMDRCEWGGHPTGYAAYGAVGIRVDPRWHTFENFLADMGERPLGTSIDRIDGSKGYAPGNCRWATPHEQNLNTSRNIRVEHDGKVKPFQDVCRELDLSWEAIKSRAVRRGNDYEAAFRSVGVEVICWRGHTRPELTGNPAHPLMRGN